MVNIDAVSTAGTARDTAQHSAQHSLKQKATPSQALPIRRFIRVHPTRHHGQYTSPRSKRWLLNSSMRWGRSFSKATSQKWIHN